MPPVALQAARVARQPFILDVVLIESLIIMQVEILLSNILPLKVWESKTDLAENEIGAEKSKMTRT